MVAQRVDLKKVIKQEYIRVNNPDNSDYPYKVFNEINTINLQDLLENYTKDNLQDIIDSLQLEIKGSLRKKLIINELSVEIIKAFKLFLETVNDRMYQLLLKLRENKQGLLLKMNNNSSYVKFLLQRGFLFRYQNQKEELLILPEELLSILNKLDDIKMKKIIKRNIEICTIGTGILYYYGVMKADDFFITLKTMFENFSQDRMNTKIKIVSLNYYTEKKGEDTCARVFRSYVNYSTKVNEFYFDKKYFAGYFSYFQVFDPYNIYYEQQKRDNLDFLPLSCKELMPENFSDKKVQDLMIRYFIEQLDVNPLKANALINEWICYIKNGIDYFLYMEIMFEQLNFQSIKMEELSQFSSIYFLNNINHWCLKGHIPEEVSIIG